MGLDELERITALRSRLGATQSWRHCIHGPHGSAKRTAAAQIIADLTEGPHGPIFVVSQERGLSRFAHLLLARGVESRRLDGQQVRELAANFESARIYSGVNLVPEPVINATAGAAVLDNEIALLVFDDPVELDAEYIWYYAPTDKTQRLLWLTTKEPSTQLFDAKSTWPALHHEYTKFERKLHLYAPESAELDLSLGIRELQNALPPGSVLSQTLARAAASSLAALEYALLRTLHDEFESEIESRLLALLARVEAITTDSKSDCIKQTVEGAVRSYRRVLVLSENVETVGEIHNMLDMADITAKAAFDAQNANEDDLAVVIGEWRSLGNIDLERFDDVVLCDLPRELEDWNRLTTNLLRPRILGPAIIHAFKRVGDLDAYSDDLLARWKFSEIAL